MIYHRVAKRCNAADRVDVVVFQQQRFGFCVSNRYIICWIWATSASVLREARLLRKSWKAVFSGLSLCRHR